MIKGFFKKITAASVILLLVFFSRVAVAIDLCQPMVKPPLEGTTLVNFLNELSQAYEFQITVPADFDRPVNVTQSMELEAMIKMLTTGMSTIVMRGELDGCPKPRITELTIISVGEDTEFLSEGLPVDTLTRIPEPKPLFIADMELYVTEVLLKKRKSFKKRMTQEQLTEFNTIKKRLRVELEDEIKQARAQFKKDKNKRKNNNKNNTH